MRENERKCIKCGCSPAQDPNITLHRFPKPAKTNGVKCELWAKYCFPHESWSSREFQNQLYSKHYMLCSKHFKKSSFSNDSGKRLRKSAAPDEECDKIASPEPILEHRNESEQPIAGPSKTRQPITNTPIEECDEITSPELILEHSNESEQPIAGPSRTRQPLTNTPIEECDKIASPELILEHRNESELPIAGPSRTRQPLSEILTNTPDEECEKIASPEPILEHSNESEQPIAGPSRTRQPLREILTNIPDEECEKIASPEPILEHSNESEQPIAGPSRTRQPLREILTNIPVEECDKISEAELVIFHQNVRSLNSNTTEKLEDVLEKYNCDILGLTEHWLSKDELEGVNIKKFKLVSSYCRSKPSADTRDKRKIRSSGGSCLFVNKTFKAVENVEICKLSEYQICEISAVNILALNLLIVCIYRKPGTKTATFFKCIKRLLYKICGFNVNCTIVGDMNIDTLVASNVSKKLYDILRCYNFKNHVKFPTRVSAALDHIYTNFCADNIEALAIETKISDHRGTCARIKFSNPRLPSVQKVEKYTNDSKLNFGAAIESINWNALSAEELAYSIINIIIDKIDYLMNLFNYNSFLEEKNENLPIRSYVRKLTDESFEYYNKVILNITKTMWPNVNWKAEKTNKPRQVIVECTNGCNFELYLAPEIITFINKKVANQMLTKDIIYNYIAPNLLLSFANIISHPLQSIFSICLREGVYPRLLKEVKVCHLYKGSKTDPRFYRQIALIPAIVKILEKGLTTRLTEHLNTRNYPLSNRQYAYSHAGSPLLIRPYTVAGSTKMVRDVIETVVNARERKLEVSILFCDLSKALDVADHIKEKFKHYGIDDRDLDLLVAFMKNRKQTVGKAGVPQVSSLSNLVYTLLLNDLPDNIKNVDVFMYAHEVAIVITASTLEELESELNETAELNFKWFQTNGLVLNISKSQFIQFNLRGGNRPPLSVTIQSQKIQQVAVATILGFQMDDRLQGNVYIDKLCSAVSTACFDLMCVASTLSIEETKACYIASVHRLLERGVKVWGHGADWKRAFELQECAVQILARESPDTPARKYFKEFGILTLPCLLIYNVAMYVVRHMGEFAINSKYSNRLVPKKYGLKRLSKTVAGMGPDVYNRIPDGIKQARDIDTFKAELKNWLLDKSFYSYSEFLTDFNKRSKASKKGDNQVTVDISQQGSTDNLHSS